jgi:integrase/recombinase XerD
MPRERLCLPISEWPARDRQLWSDGTRSGRLFEVVGAGARWSPRSCFKTQQGYARWLAWLAASGQLDETTDPGARVTRVRIGAYLDALSVTGAPFTLICRIQELIDALRVLAPQLDRGWLNEIHTTLQLRAVPVRDKRRRLRPVADLVALGRQLMDQAETSVAWSPRKRALGYRDGLMIALLAHRPVRQKNFAAIRLGQHLVRQGGRYWLLFAAAETKTGALYEAVIPDVLAAALQHYLDAHRPVLLHRKRGCASADLDALWVSKGATPLAIGSLRGRIVQRTQVAFGASLPPHWFRDAAATTIAIEDPKHARDAQHVLGHASHKTTERYYNQARSLEGSRRHQALLISLGASPNQTRHDR